MPDAPAGPHVALAVLCQRYDRQQDGTVDVIGIVDGLGFTVPSIDALREDPPVIALTALVVLRAGPVRGRHHVTIRGTFPSGLPGPSVGRSIAFSDRAPGASLTVPLELVASEAGTYWFDVLFDERCLTRISLHVVVDIAAGS